MIHSAAQATLTSMLLSGVPGYTQNTPSPPPGLAPIDAQVSGVSDCSKAVSSLKVSTSFFSTVYLSYFSSSYWSSSCVYVCCVAAQLNVQNIGCVFGRQGSERHSWLCAGRRRSLRFWTAVQQIQPRSRCACLTDPRYSTRLQSVRFHTNPNPHMSDMSSFLC